MSKSKSGAVNDNRRSNAAASEIPSRPKLFIIIEMLRRPSGATMQELIEVTGWKPNSIRGAISGAIGKRRIMEISSEKVAGIRTYRIISRKDRV
jgi:hypothetical protein